MQLIILVILGFIIGYFITKNHLNNKKLMTEIDKHKQTIKNEEENNKILRARLKMFGDAHAVPYVSTEDYNITCIKAEEMFNKMKS